MAITRRQVLVAMGALAASSVVVSGAVVIRWWDKPAGTGLEALSEGEYELVQAMAEAWMPAGSGPPEVSGREANCGAFVDEVVERMEPTQKKLFKVLLNALDEMPLITHRKRFTALDREVRADLLWSWLHSPLYLHRQAVGAVMALISFGYEVHPEVSAVFAPWHGCGFGR